MLTKVGWLVEEGTKTVKGEMTQIEGWKRRRRGGTGQKRCRREKGGSGRTEKYHEERM